MMTATTGTLHVQLIDSDLANGDPCEPEHCPISLAIARAFPGAQSVCVDRSSAEWVGLDGFCYSAELPKIGKIFVTVFDDDETRSWAQLIEFDLEYSVS